MIPIIQLTNQNYEIGEAVTPLTLNILGFFEMYTRFLYKKHLYKKHEAQIW